MTDDKYVIAFEFKNIKLHQAEWEEPVNLCLIKSTSMINVSTWLPRIVQHGYLIIHDWYTPDSVTHYINQYFTMIKTVDNMVLFQKL